MKFYQETLPLAGEPVHLSYAREFPEASDDLYWASLWPSSVALAEHLAGREDLEGRKVLELGCGCGLAGIAAGKQGAEVTVTDVMPGAIDLAERNWALNGLEPANTELLDWCQPDLEARFDLILGADILYHPRDYPILIQTLRDLMHEEGRLMIADPGRSRAHEFFARMLRAGYAVDTVHHDVDLHDQTFPVTVSEFR